MIRAVLLTSSCSLFLMPATAMAGRLEVASATASSTYSGEGTYTADRSIDGKQSTSWVEGDSGAGLGAMLTLELNESSTITHLKVWAGDWYDMANWGRANRPKEIELKFSDGSTEIHTLDDEMTVQTLKLAKPVQSSSVRLRLKSVYGGSAWMDTVISEVQVFGDSESAIDIKGWSASSVHEPDGDGNYEAQNAGDGMVDGMWCEGDEGDGTGSWLQVDFSKPTAISGFSMINGVGSSLGLWMKSNRSTKATLTFSDGKTVDVDLKPSIRPSKTSIAPVTTSSVRLTFTSVTKGKEYNDLCVSELVFE
ncbi:MAG: discoidin domain-containing protein [Myxococcota bacterium]